MSIDERLDRLVERHEALTERHEALARSIKLLSIETRELRDAISRMSIPRAQDGERIRALLRTAEKRDRQ